MILNQSKTKCILFGTQHDLEIAHDFVLQQLRKIIERVSTWKEHVENVCTKVTKRLGLFRLQIWYYLTLKVAQCVYHSVIVNSELATSCRVILQ